MSDIVLKGFVQLRRGLLTHLMDGRISPNEFAVFTILLMLADKETGSYRINASAVRFWTGNQMSRDSADRALRGLEEKGYIVREIATGSRSVYAYHIQKFVVTHGAEAGKVLMFKKNSNGIEKIEELLQAFTAKPAEEGADNTAEDTAEETAEESAEETADKTILETGNLRLETGDLNSGESGKATSPQPDEAPSPEAEGKADEPVRLMRHFYKLLGQPLRHKGKDNAWVERLKRLSAQPAHIQSVMDWAMQHPNWSGYIASSTKVDPLEYFCSKFDTIEACMEGDEMRQKNLKKKARQTAAPKGTFGEKYEQGGTDFFKRNQEQQ